MIDALRMCVMSNVDACWELRIRVNKQAFGCMKLCKSIPSLRRVFDLVLMDPLFQVKVSTALVISCVTFTVLFVPLAE